MEAIYLVRDQKFRFDPHTLRFGESESRWSEELKVCWPYSPSPIHHASVGLCACSNRAGEHASVSFTHMVLL